MSSKGKSGESKSPSTPLLQATDVGQLDFELDFYAGILQRNPEYVDVLRVFGNNLTIQGRWEEGLKIDKRLIRLRPHDALAHYNLACSYSLLRKTDLGFRALRKAIELGYRDFRYMQEDKDLDHLRKDPRFRQILAQFLNY